MPRLYGGLAKARTLLLLAMVLSGTASYFNYYFRPARSFLPGPLAEPAFASAAVRPARSGRAAESDSSGASTPATAKTAVAEDPGEQRFSPAENLERLDYERLRGARHTVDIAMYSFTDLYLAEELVALSRRGVRIRLYRDRQQYDEEQRNARQRGRPSTTDLLRGEPNIQVRIKAGTELMHLKTFLVDGRLLRDGSANWSPAGLKLQDNNAHYTADPAQVLAFREAFERMWSRPENQRVP